MFSQSRSGLQVCFCVTIKLFVFVTVPMASAKRLGRKLRFGGKISASDYFANGGAVCLWIINLCFACESAERHWLRIILPTAADRGFCVWIFCVVIVVSTLIRLITAAVCISNILHGIKIYVCDNLKITYRGAQKYNWAVEELV